MILLFKRFLAEGIDRTTANHYLMIAQLVLERMYCPDPENHIAQYVSSAPNPARGPFLGSRDSFILFTLITEPNQYYLEFFINCFESMVQ